jgi:pyruvate dehydrogenase E1 component alpha subunit
MTPDPDLRQELLRDMLRLRAVEVRIEDLYHLDQMKTPVHLCIGQEAVAVGVCSALRRDDLVQSNHRSHGHYLAKGGDLDALIAELHCKQTGCSRGFGGSMHLCDPAVGHLGSSSIVGGGIPIGVGMALAQQQRGTDKVAVTFFGDGALDEGVLYESVNFAMLHRLPVIFVYENNGYSVCTPLAVRQAGEALFHRADPKLLASTRVDGNDVEAVRGAALAAVERARAGEGPSFVECRTYRMREHAGAGVDRTGLYRQPDEIAAWEALDPVARYRRHLLAEGVVSQDDLTVMEAEIEREIDDAFAAAAAAPLPDPASLEHHVYTAKEA